MAVNKTCWEYDVGDIFRYGKNGLFCIYLICRVSCAHLIGIHKKTFILIQRNYGL